MDYAFTDFPDRVPWSSYGRRQQFGHTFRLIPIKHPNVGMGLQHYSCNREELVKISQSAYRRPTTTGQMWNRFLGTAEVLIVAIDNYGIAQAYCSTSSFWNPGLGYVLYIQDMAVKRELQNNGLGVAMLRLASETSSEENKREGFLALSQSPVMYRTLKSAFSNIYPAWGVRTSDLLRELSCHAPMSVIFRGQGAKDAHVKALGSSVIINWYEECQYSSIPWTRNSDLNERFAVELSIKRNKTRDAMSLVGYIK